MLRLGGHTVALSTSCSLERSANLLDARVKTSAGTSQVVEDITWNITCDSLLGINADTEQHTYATLMALMDAGAPVDVEVFLASNAHKAVPAGDWVPGPSASKGFAPYGGKALISSLSLTGDATSNAKLRISLSGQGLLQRIDYPVTMSIKSKTLTINGPAEVIDGKLVIDGNYTITDNTLNL